MAINKKKKKIFAIVAGFAGLLALYYYGKPEARFKRDSRNAKTAWGAYYLDYLAKNNLKISNSEIENALKYHKENNTSFWAPYAQKGWSLM